MRENGRVLQHADGQLLGGGIERAHACGLDFSKRACRWSRQFIASRFARHAHQPGADDAVVEELLVAVDERPPKADSPQQQAR